MKLLILGDTHFSSKSPKRRIDDYIEAQFKKINFVIDYAVNNFIDLIIQPGDLLDKSTDISYRIVNRLIKTLRQDGSVTPVPIWTIAGNHTSYFRQQGTEHTAYTNLLYADAVKEIPYAGEAISYVYKNDVYTGNRCLVYGCEYGKEIPTPHTPKDYNILAVHVGVNDTEIAFDTNEKWWTPVELMKAYPDYNLIISGHNHKDIGHLRYRNRNLINCGSLMRSSIAQKDHTPCFYVFDTENGSCERIEIPHDPAEVVFDLSKYAEEKSLSKELSGFSGEFKNVQISLDFPSRMDYYIRTNGVEESVAKQIYECMGE